jgi:hypothetical protein
MKKIISILYIIFIIGFIYKNILYLQYIVFPIKALNEDFFYYILGPFIFFFSTISIIVFFLMWREIIYYLIYSKNTKIGLYFDPEIKKN